MPEIVEEFCYYHPEILVVAAIAFVGSIWVMQRLIGVLTIRHLTIPAVFYLTYLVMIFFPSFWVYLDRPGPFRDSFIQGVISVLITVPLGIFLANRMFRFSKREVAKHYDASVDELRPSLHMYIVHLILVAAALGIVIVYFIQVPTIPVFQMFANPGDTLALTLAREESFKLLDPRWKSEASTMLFYPFLFLRTLLFPVLILTTMGYYLSTREPKWLILFLVTFLVGGFYAVSSLARAPISAIFMRIFFFLYLFHRGRMSRLAMIVFVVLMLAFPALVTMFVFTGEFNATAGLEAIALRLTYTPALDLYYYFEIFPSTHDYLHGHTLLKPFLKLIEADYFYIENYVHLYISPYGVESGHANAAFISNLHADFGLWGVLIGGVLTGTFIQGLQIHLTRQRKTVFNIALYSFMVYAIWALNFGSVTSVLFVNGVVPVFILIWMIRLSEQSLQIAVGGNPSDSPRRMKQALSSP